jgi:hypothetical protein
MATIYIVRVTEEDNHQGGGQTDTIGAARTFEGAKALAEREAVQWRLDADIPADEAPIVWGGWGGTIDHEDLQLQIEIEDTTLTD